MRGILPHTLAHTLCNDVVISMSAPPLPSDAIQRVLFISSSVHVYQIPPLTSTKGYFAASWTENNNARQIFTARVRILETAIPLPDGSGESLSTEIRLEDPSTGDLFAAAPYTEPSAVEAALDSSRFFAARVQGEGGRKAMLGIGFEERSEAMDFGIALQEARKIWSTTEIGGSGAKSGKEQTKENKTVKRDFSLKEGEMIRIDLGTKGRSRKEGDDIEVDQKKDGKGLFSIAPPPPPSMEKGVGSSAGSPFLPPPPSAPDSKAHKRRSRQNLEPVAKSAQELGFDDGEFGEFQ